MHCEPGSGATSRWCGFGSPSIPAPRSFPCFNWVPARNTWRTCSSTRYDSAWPPFCLPLFTSDGLNLYFYALTAHFGHWLQVSRQGRKVLRWQVAAELIYGQVKQSYRRRKLARVTPVMRLGTEAALTSARPRMGFSGRLNTAFIERVNLTVRDARGSARTTYLGHVPTGSTAAGSPRVVARVLPFCASSCIAADRASAASRTRGQTARPTRPPTYPSHGSRQNPSEMDGAFGALIPVATGFRLEAFKPDMVAVACRGESGEGASRSTRMDPSSRMRWPVRTAH